MTQIADPATLDLLVTRVVDQANARLTATAAAAKTGTKTFDAAKQNAGNQTRSHDIRVSLDAETRLAADASALSKRLARVKKSMRDDLGLLVATARGDDAVTGT